MKRFIGLSALPLILVTVLAVWQFPYATDPPVIREEEIKAFYTMAYADEGAETTPNWLKVAEDARTRFRVKEGVESFVREHHLEQAKVLDVGSGTGYLQDVVEDYTGLDISPSVAKHYRKPFVAGTATAMAFKDDTFDAVWSIWVLEHIPNPEAALREIRRVVKPGGYLYLQPAWDVKPWAAEGHEVRPYRDLSFAEKLSKATIPIRSSPVWWFASHVPARTVRALTSSAGPSTFHYRRLTPNYEEYWQADSDAVNDLDSHELARWFTSRGDECLQCPSLVSSDYPLIIRRR